jgi:hypothetical protein
VGQGEQPSEPILAPALLGSLPKITPPERDWPMIPSGLFGIAAASRVYEEGRSRVGRASGPGA